MNFEITTLRTKIFIVVVLILMFGVKPNISTIVDIDNINNNLTDNSFNYNLSIITTSLILNYFNEHSCFNYVKDVDFEFYINLQQITKQFTISVIQLDNNLNFEHDMETILNNYENKCDWFLVQTVKPVRFIDLIIKITKVSNHRENSRIVFLPINVNNMSYDVINDDYAQNVFQASKDFLPNVLVLDITYNYTDPAIEFKTSNWLTGDSITLYVCTFVNCNVTEVDLFPDKLSQLQGKELRLAAFHYPPYSFLQPQLDGSEYRVFYEFSKLYNCTFSVHTEEGMWGEIFEDTSTGIGVLGTVYRGDADFGYSALYLWSNELQHLDFSATYVRTGVTCLVPKTQQVSQWLVPFLPFDKILWTLTLSTLTIGTVTLYYVAKVANQFSSNWRMRFRTISDSFIRVVGLLVLQTPTAKGTRPPPLPLRYIITWLEIMFLLIVTSYHSGLATMLTVRKYEKPISTVQDLVDSGLHWGNSNNAWKYSIRLTQEKNTKILLDRFLKVNKEYLVDHVKTRDYAFAIERLSGGFFALGDFVTEDALSYLQLMKEDIYYEYVITITPKASPYLGHLNKLINRVLGAGLNLYWEAEVVRQYLSLHIQYGVGQSNNIETKLDPSSLQLKQIYGNLFILTIGHLLATAAFILEHLWYRKTKSKWFKRNATT